MVVSIFQTSYNKDGISVMHPGYVIVSLLKQSISFFFEIMHQPYQFVLKQTKNRFLKLLLQETSMLNPLPDDKISDWSKLRQIADDNLKCNKMNKWAMTALYLSTG